MLWLQAFHSYGLRWWLFVCWIFFGWLGFSLISEGGERQNKQWAHRGLKNQKRLAFFFLPRWPQQQQMHCLAQIPTEERR